MAAAKNIIGITNAHLASGENTQKHVRTAQLNRTYSVTANKNWKWKDYTNTSLVSEQIEMGSWVLLGYIYKEIKWGVWSWGGVRQGQGVGYRGSYTAKKSTV